MWFLMGVTALTPADEHVNNKVFVLREDDNEERVQVQTLH